MMGTFCCALTATPGTSPGATTRKSKRYSGTPVVSFGGDGIDNLNISGDSWLRNDPLAGVFHEANAGPHRLFVETWRRQREADTLASETVTPSPYNTLVNFVYDIGVGDMSAAAALVTDAALVQTAIDLGLAKDPWTGLCGGIAAETPPPCNVVAPDGRSWTVDMVQSDDTWLVSGVGPAPSTVMPTSSIR
jgi:hypothetical protein